MTKITVPLGMNVVVPTKQTLDKYGLDEQAWLAILKDQDWACFVCEKLPPSGRLVVDHYHAKGWKKMLKEKRKLYIRGLLCWTCNHYLVGRGVTVQKSRRVTLYLEQFESRMPK